MDIVMRMRRIPEAVKYLSTSPSHVKKPVLKAGQWKEDRPKGLLHLEIGCGKGGYSAALAKMHPNETFVAVERNETAAGLAARKFDESQCDNLSLIHGDGALLEEWFHPGEIDILHLNFSDPWPKKRNAKRRLTAPSFLKQYDKILSKDGQIVMKTDNPSLFEYSVLEFLQAGFILEEFSVDFRREEHLEDPLTEYEQKFVQAGHPIYRSVWKKGDFYEKLTND